MVVTPVLNIIDKKSLKMKNIQYFSMCFILITLSASGEFKLIHASERGPVGKRFDAFNIFKAFYDAFNHRPRCMWKICSHPIRLSAYKQQPKMSKNKLRHHEIMELKKMMRNYLIWKSILFWIEYLNWYLFGHFFSNEIIKFILDRLRYDS